MDADVASLVGPETRALDIAGEPEAQILALRPCLFLLGRKVRGADCGCRHVKRPYVLTAVERHLQAVGEQQALARIRKLVLANEIAPADFQAIEAKLLGELVHGALDREAGMRPAAAAVGR